MKALSIKQPWASLVCTPRLDNPLLGIKDIENRTWATKYRGTIYIHASSKPAFTGSYKDNLPSKFWDSLSEKEKWAAIDSFQHRGAIIGKVDIVDCVINHGSIWAEQSETYVRSHVGIISKPPIYNWVLANPVLFDKPILNVKGKLSLWEFDGKEVTNE
ncbi:ASCH domain-containing protein [Sphingobacterium sp.]|uniref:ASCH domain-containing protein n=1 Tax=Sphingobacterium sp. TaxID=341027 RepID=UPI0028A2C199|nr:ASCH domain-containing protein [Sphingobacterium sp.]